MSESDCSRQECQTWILLVVVFFYSVPRPLMALSIPDVETAKQINAQHPIYRLGEHEPDISKMEEEIKSVNNEICVTPGCVLAAGQFIESMDLNADPCDDIYQYTCGNFIKRTIIPDNTDYKLSDILQEEHLEKLRLLMDNTPANTSSRSYKLAKNFYLACTNERMIETTGLDYLKNILKELGGWPVVEGDEWDAASFSWTNTTYMMTRLGFHVNYLIDLSVTNDPRNQTRRCLDIDQPNLSLPRDVLMHKTFLRLQYMLKLATALGASKDVESLEELTHVLQFEMKLANISLTPQMKRDASKKYFLLKLSHLEEKFPSVPWLEYLLNVIPTANIQPDELILLGANSYLEHLEVLLKETPKRVVANYMFWRMVEFTVSFLPLSVRKMQPTFYELEPRWKKCLKLTESRYLVMLNNSISLEKMMSLAVGSMYVKRFFDETQKKHALRVYEGVKEEVFTLLRTVELMDKESREKALEKAMAVTYEVGYPDEILNETKVDEFYNELQFGSGIYLEEALNLNKFLMRNYFQRLRRPVDKSEWFVHARPAEINAYYNRRQNSIYIPAAILQGLFYSSDRPNYLNFGAIGHVIGHELTHGFKIRDIKKPGNTDSMNAYKEREQCFIDQYSNYTVKDLGIHLDGRKTLSENIADNGGVKLAYQAYLRWVAEHGPESRLPGLQHLSPQQMFWVSFANTMCGKLHPISVKNRIAIDVHALPEFRIKGVCSNSPEFARDFNCPLGSKMNPVDKCHVW